jgi:imidazolonepropionase-like amidohydrolase
MTNRRAYRAAWLLDGRAEEPLHDAAILIEDGRIAWVGPFDDLPAGSPVHSLGEVTLLPGLIDLHAHLVWSGGPDPAALVEQEGFGLTLLRAYANARANLLGGVTTVVDLGSNWDIAILVARAIRLGALPGPRLIPAGRSVAMTGGHDPFWANFADGPDAVLRAVRQQRDAGAGIIKLAATGGVYGRAEGEDVGHAELSAEELAVAIREAHRFGLKVAAHAVGHEGIGNCLIAGVDLIQHGILADEDQLRAMAAADATLVPTLIPYRQIAANPRGAIPEYAVAKARPLVERHRRVVARALELDVRIGAGSDAGSPDLPHPALHQELSCLVAAGLSPGRAVRAATADAAAALGLEREIGALAPGLAADVVALAGDLTVAGGEAAPFRPDRVRLVLQAGVEVPPT